jgi:HK97 family phage major capsid protein
MSKILDLKLQRTEKWDEARAFLDSHKDENDRLSVENRAVYEKMETEVIALGKDIELLERARELDGEMSVQAGKALVGQPGGPSNREDKASDHYRQDFWNTLRGKPAIHNALAVGSDPLGGYLVPEDFERTLVESLEEYNIMRPLARIIHTSTKELKIPVVAAKGSAAWVEEAAVIPTSDNEFGQVVLDAFKLATIIKVSRELMADSAFPLESYLAQDFGRRLGTLEEEAFIIGDGNKKPTGFLSAAQVGATAASATAISFDNVMDLYHSLRSPYRNKAVFITNDLTIKALRKLKDNNGQFLWQPSPAAGAPDTILGRPVYVSSFMPQIAAGAKVMAFGDFSYYWIADRQGRIFERINELYTETDQVGFKATQRVDGKLILPESVQVMAMGAS